MTTVAALYCHIPFCHGICPFCAFAVHKDRRRLHRPYLDALRREIALVGAAHGGGPPLGSLYVGGGTPSTLAPGEVVELLEWMRRHLPLAPDAEVAFEVNPEDARPDYLAALKQAGVTRVSLGVQSLEDRTLQALGRGHSAAQAQAGLLALRLAGLVNHNADLMFGAPGVGGEDFQHDVQRIAALKPPHLSLYGLDVEERTLFGRSPAVRAWEADHREDQCEQFLWAAHHLTTAGYRHYEVSNFCLPGYEGRQNLIVWRGDNYLGLGLGAHSYGDGERWHNERHLTAYLRALEQNRLPIAGRERLSPAQQANEHLMLALRQDTGLEVAEWEARWGFPWDARRQELARRLEDEGKAFYAGSRLRLTPRGFVIADGITEGLMVE